MRPSISFSIFLLQCATSFRITHDLQLYRASNSLCCPLVRRLRGVREQEAALHLRPGECNIVRISMSQNVNQKNNLKRQQGRTPRTAPIQLPLLKDFRDLCGMVETIHPLLAAGRGSNARMKVADAARVLSKLNSFDGTRAGRTLPSSHAVKMQDIEEICVGCLQTNCRALRLKQIAMAFNALRKSWSKYTSFFEASCLRIQEIVADADRSNNYTECDGQTVSTLVNALSQPTSLQLKGANETIKCLLDTLDKINISSFSSQGIAMIVGGCNRARQNHPVLTFLALEMLRRPTQTIDLQAAALIAHGLKRLGRLDVQVLGHFSSVFLRHSSRSYQGQTMAMAAEAFSGSNVRLQEVLGHFTKMVDEEVKLDSRSVVDLARIVSSWDVNCENFLNVLMARSLRMEERKEILSRLSSAPEDPNNDSPARARSSRASLLSSSIMRATAHALIDLSLEASAASREILGDVEVLLLLLRWFGREKVDQTILLALRLCVEAAVGSLKEAQRKRSTTMSKSAISAFDLSVLAHAVADSLVAGAVDNDARKGEHMQTDSSSLFQLNQAWEVVTTEIEFCVRHQLLSASAYASCLNAVCKMPSNERILNILFDSVQCDDWDFPSQAITLKMLTSFKTSCRNQQLKSRLEVAILKVMSVAVQSLNENSSIKHAVMVLTSLEHACSDHTSTQLIAVLRFLGSMKSRYFDAQGIANIFNFIVNLDKSSRKLSAGQQREIEEVEEQVKQALIEATYSLYSEEDSKASPPSSFSAQELALVINALARLGRKDDVLLRMLLSHAWTISTREPDSLDAQAIAMICNGMTRLKVQDLNLLRSFSKIIRRRPPQQFSHQQASMVLNSYANSRLRDQAVFQHLIKLVGGGLGGSTMTAERRRDRDKDRVSPSAQSISMTMHAMAVLDIQGPEGVVECLVDELVSLDVASSSGQAVANIAWSVAALQVSGRVHDWLLDAIKFHIANMDRACLFQVHQYLLDCALRDIKGSYKEGQQKLQMASKSIPSHLLLDSSTSMKAVAAGVGRGLAGGAGLTVSRLQSDVIRTLRGMGVEVEEEWMEPRSRYVVDAWLPTFGIALEVDGPYHYAYSAGSAQETRPGSATVRPDGNGRHPLGSTKLKHRHLAELMIPVLVVPYWEWPEDSQASKQTYLSNLLFSHVGSVTVTG